MEIKTKYNIKDEVAWLEDNKVHAGEITAIHFHQWKNSSVTIEYTVEEAVLDESGVRVVYEKNLFSSKEELLKSL